MILFGFFWFFSYFVFVLLRKFIKAAIIIIYKEKLTIIVLISRHDLYLVKKIIYISIGI